MNTATYTNFDFLQSVVNKLRYSQGYYGRLARQLEELTEDEISNIEEQLPDFKDTTDVIFYLEG